MVSRLPTNTKVYRRYWKVPLKPTARSYPPCWKEKWKWIWTARWIWISLRHLTSPGIINFARALRHPTYLVLSGKAKTSGLDQHLHQQSQGHENQTVESPRPQAEPDWKCVKATREEAKGGPKSKFSLCVPSWSPTLCLLLTAWTKGSLAEEDLD